MPSYDAMDVCVCSDNVIEMVWIYPRDIQYYTAVCFQDVLDMFAVHISISENSSRHGH